MATLQYEDETTHLSIASASDIGLRSPEFLAFTASIYDTPFNAFLASYVVVQVDPHEYNITLVTPDARTLEQRIRLHAGGWQVRQQSLSSYFTLAELLLNNFVRTALQDLIDEAGVSAVTLTLG